LLWPRPPFRCPSIRRRRKLCLFPPRHLPLPPRMRIGQRPVHATGFVVVIQADNDDPVRTHDGATHSVADRPAIELTKRRGFFADALWRQALQAAAMCGCAG
jgi:hypothetical protein